MNSSTGGHVRHSFDHLKLPIKYLEERKDSEFHYDIRSRDTPMEHDRVFALESVMKLQKNVSLLGKELLF